MVTIQDNCVNHPAANAIEHCGRCGNALCGMCAQFTNSGVFCETCAEIKENEQFVESQTRQLERPAPVATEQPAEPEFVPPNQKQRNPNTIPIAVITLCLLIIGGYQLSRMSNRFQPMSQEQVLQDNRVGSVERCLLVFADIGKELAAGRSPADSLVCDDSGTPNIVEREGQLIRVSHPHPDFYGYSRIFVTNRNPQPTLIE